MSLYFPVCREHGRRAGLPRRAPDAVLRKRKTIWEPEQRISWEYYNGRAWVTLVVADGTKTSPSRLHRLCRSRRHGQDAEVYRRPLLDSGAARNGWLHQAAGCVASCKTPSSRQRPHRPGRDPGSSDGTPLQKLHAFARTTARRSGHRSARNARSRSAKKSRNWANTRCGWPTIAKAATWSAGAKSSFFESGPKSRHYIIDPLTRQVRFGDGIRGMVPPVSPQHRHRRGISRRWRQQRQRQRNTLTSLTRAVPILKRSITSFLPSVVPMQKRSSRPKNGHRCRSEPRSRRHIGRLRDAGAAFDDEHCPCQGDVIRRPRWPRPSGDHPARRRKNLDLTRKLVPPPELCRFVRNYLDERRLITTILDDQAGLCGDFAEGDADPPHRRTERAIAHRNRTAAASLSASARRWQRWQGLAVWSSGVSHRPRPHGRRHPRHRSD